MSLSSVIVISVCSVLSPALALALNLRLRHRSGQNDQLYINSETKGAQSEGNTASRGGTNTQTWPESLHSFLFYLHLSWSECVCVLSVPSVFVSRYQRLLGKHLDKMEAGDADRLAPWPSLQLSSSSLSWPAGGEGRGREGGREGVLILSAR